jgi:hypothetical protein
MSRVPRPRASHEGQRPVPTIGRDPIGDIDLLMHDLQKANFDLRRLAHIAFFIRFADRRGWERAAATAVADGWQADSYSEPGSLMLQLSCRARPTPSTLERHRTAVSQIARSCDGRWESLAVERLPVASSWDAVIARHIHHADLPYVDNVRSDADIHPVAATARQTQTIA